MKPKNAPVRKPSTRLAEKPSRGRIMAPGKKASPKTAVAVKKGPAKPGRAAVGQGRGNRLDKAPAKPPPQPAGTRPRPKPRAGKPKPGAKAAGTPSAPKPKSALGGGTAKRKAVSTHPPKPKPATRRATGEIKPAPPSKKPAAPEFSAKTPRQLHFRMPAEWEQHFGTFMTWPNKKGISFPGKGAFDAVLPTFESMLRALISSEELFVNISSEEEKQTIRDFLTIAEQRKVHFIDTPAMEPWCRDHGCTFVVRDADRAGGAIIWKFNAWGGKYTQALVDGQISLRMAQYLGGKLFDPGLVLEGGSIEVNGAGTVLTTESCLLNKNRNKGMKKDEVERALKDFLNVRNVLWLPGGLEGDDTDGHIDTITRFISRDTVLTVVEDNPKDKNHLPLKRNFELLQRMKLEDGADLQVIPLPMPKPIIRKNQRLPASYANFYITNKVVLLPTFDDPADEKALEIMVKSFPTRRIFPIDCRELVWGLGAFHCLTQQLPLAAFPKVIDLIRNPQPSPRPVY